MNRITIHNYESFFLDFVEGRLSPGLETELYAFLGNHPGLQAELESIRDYQANIPTTPFPYREALKKIDPGPYTLEQFEEQCVAFIEGDLTAREKQDWKAFIKQDPTREREFRLFEKTRINPGYQVVFPGKNTLYKHVPSRFGYWLYPLAAAAGLALLWTLMRNEQVTIPLDTGQVTIETRSTQPEYPIDHELPSTSERLEANEPVPAQQTSLASISDRARLRPGTVSPNSPDRRDTDRYMPIGQIGITLLTDPPADRPATRKQPEKPKYTARVETRVEVPSSPVALLQRLRPAEINKISLEQLEGTDLLALTEAGINRLGEITGNGMKMETRQVEEKNTRVLSFESRLFGFSTTINKTQGEL